MVCYPDQSIPSLKEYFLEEYKYKHEDILMSDFSIISMTQKFKVSCTRFTQKNN